MKVKTLTEQEFIDAFLEEIVSNEDDSKEIVDLFTDFLDKYEVSSKARISFIRKGRELVKKIKESK